MVEEIGSDHSGRGIGIDGFEHGLAVVGNVGGSVAGLGQHAKMKVARPPIRVLSLQPVQGTAT